MGFLILLKDNMDSHLQNIFLRELQQQCEYATIAYDDLLHGLSTRDTTRVFHSLQSFLIASANISKIFWPQKTE